MVNVYLFPTIKFDEARIYDHFVIFKDRRKTPEYFIEVKGEKSFIIFTCCQVYGQKLKFLLNLFEFKREVNKCKFKKTKKKLYIVNKVLL